jgi:hypothetical protein
LKGRDLAILAAVVLLGGFALADALRGRGEEARQTTTEATRTARTGPEPQADAPVNWPSGLLRGTLVFTDADDCRVRVIGLGGGRERPVGVVAGMCEFWAPPVGQRIASRTAGATTGEGPGWFEIVDLARTNRELGEFKGLIGDVLWSPDAQRVAWCDHSGFGLELEVGDTRPRRLALCPSAYNHRGRLVFAAGKRLLAEDGRVLLKERDPITQAHWGSDESLLVVLANGVVRRYAGPAGLVGVHEIRLSANGDILPSPDNCALLTQELDRIEIVDVGCAGLRTPSFFGFDAAWSPDGRWIAVADRDQIEFHELLTGNQRLVWPARARELYWRGD